VKLVDVVVDVVVVVKIFIEVVDDLSLCCCECHGSSHVCGVVVVVVVVVVQT
jgi:hypothetical protein